MIKSNATVTQQIGHAAIAFETRRPGHAPDSATVVRSENSLVITPHISGIEVGEATAEIEPAIGTVVQAFTSGTILQVNLLAGNVAGESWIGSVPIVSFEINGVHPCWTWPGRHLKL